MRDLDDLVRAGDDEALLLAIDRLAAARDWDGLADLGRRCRAAVEVGRQLWGVALHVDYRLALEAPPADAAAALAPGTGRFTLGPLPEVAASTHTWADLAPHLRDPVTATTVAAERVVRGEDVRGEDVRGDDVGQEGLAGAALADPDLPLRLQRWEPGYAVATYRDRSASFPRPDIGLPAGAASGPLRAAPRLPDDPGAAALRAAAAVWAEESTGEVTAVAVDGDASGAVGRLLVDASRAPEAALARLEPGDALAVLQWTGASGGAHGRRRGGAAGRFAAWWAAAMLAGLEWPPDPDDLGDAVAELSWWAWRPPGPEHGWVLRLAVADPVDGLGWAVEAIDAEGGVVAGI